jgi:hypothetical protein
MLETFYFTGGKDEFAELSVSPEFPVFMNNRKRHFADIVHCSGAAGD